MERKRYHRGQITITLCVGPIFSYISALLFFIPSPKVAVHSEKSGGQDKICVLYQTIKANLQKNK